MLLTLFLSWILDNCLLAVNRILLHLIREHALDRFAAVGFRDFRDDIGDFRVLNFVWKKCHFQQNRNYLDTWRNQAQSSLGTVVSR